MVRRGSDSGCQRETGNAPVATARRDRWRPASAMWLCVAGYVPPVTACPYVRDVVDTLGGTVHPELATAVDALGITEETRPLETASSFSRKPIEDARQFLSDKLSPDLPIDVVVFGSIAREEASTASDLDSLVVTHGLLDDPGAGVREVIEALEQLRDDQLGLEAPGATGIFGKLVAAPDLVERIGLEDDTNPHHTRRILLLTESASILNEARHEKRAIARRYLAD
jgi:predicted nucleotidyltransferase